MSNKEKVLKTAKELIIKNGFHGCSMKNIVEESGVSTGGVYYHFKAKDDIINELYYNIKEDIVTMLQAETDLNEPTKVFIKKFWYARIKWAENNQCSKKFLDMYYESPYKHTKINEELAKRYETLVKRVRKAVDDGELIDMKCDFFFADIDSSVNVAGKYLDKHPELDRDEFLDFAFKKYWRSVVNI